MEHARTPRAMPHDDAAGGDAGATGRACSCPATTPTRKSARSIPRGEGHASYEILPGRGDAALRSGAANHRAQSRFHDRSRNQYLSARRGRRNRGDRSRSRERCAMSRYCSRKRRGRIRWILVTHTHHDHSPAAAMLKAKTGAQLLGMPPPPARAPGPELSPGPRARPRRADRRGRLSPAGDSYPGARIEPALLPARRARSCSSPAITSCRARPW